MLEPKFSRATSLNPSNDAYFTDVETKDQKYQPFLRPSDKPSIWLNKATMDQYRPEMKKFYYDAARYPTYLDQLGIKYPTVRTASTPAATPTADADAEEGGSVQQ